MSSVPRGACLWGLPTRQAGAEGGWGCCRVPSFLAVSFVRGLTGCAGHSFALSVSFASALGQGRGGRGPTGLAAPAPQRAPSLLLSGGLKLVLPGAASPSKTVLSFQHFFSPLVCFQIRSHLSTTFHASSQFLKRQYPFLSFSPPIPGLKKSVVFRFVELQAGSISRNATVLANECAFC